MLQFFCGRNYQSASFVAEILIVFDSLAPPLLSIATAIYSFLKRKLRPLPMPPDHLLSRSAKRQIIAFFGYRKPIEYSKEWSFLQNVSALLPGEAIERMPNLIYRSICSSNLHWLTTSGDFRLASTESTQDRALGGIGHIPVNIGRTGFVTNREKEPV